jgi:L-ascorbate metabolism protein UlaG (beta-lactamase superfamily)
LADGPDRTYARRMKSRWLVPCVLALACEKTPAPEASPPPSAAPPATTTSSAPAPTPSASAAAPVPDKPAVTDTLETSAGPVRVTPLHHGTLAFDFGGKIVVVDPYSKAPAGWLPKADLVLITDIHPDHYDPAGIEQVKKPGTVFVAPKVVVEKLPEAKQLDNGKELTELGIRIKAIAMYNLERGPEAGKKFHDKGRGNGYVLGFGDKQVYVSGDTECIPEMKALTKIDLAFVCMNLPYTMTPKEAAQCINAFKPKVVIPYHYRGSDLSELAREVSKDSGVEIRNRDFYAGGS